MQDNFSSGVRAQVGVLGGGQLARMLLLEAYRLGLEPHVLCNHIDDPAAQVCPRVQIGSLDSSKDLKTFFTTLQWITIESEFLNTDEIEAIRTDAKFAPRADILAKIQDRLSQKQLLDKFKIPTSPYAAWNKDVPIESFFEKFKDGFVVKKRRYGYDGYGTFILRNKNESINIRHDPLGYIVEKFIPFEKELAFSIARNARGEFAEFPLVETHQVKSRCLWVKGPVIHEKFQSIVAQFKKLMSELDYQGILAVELFDSRGELLVNELAPRVHNSAHYSMNALSLNQFEAHWRAILDWPLSSPKVLTNGFAMVNLLGEDPRAIVNLIAQPLGWLHWYGKQEIREGRKMGHINTVGATPDAALEAALSWRKGFRI